MPDPGGQSVRRRRLAAELRRLRERTGLTGDQVAERLGWSGSKISRIELNRIGVKLADLRKLLDLYGVSPAHRADLQALAEESSQAGQREPVAAGLPADYTEYLSEEDEARSIWNWDPLIVPGLLQTEDYARAVHRGYQLMFRLPPEEAERRVELRRLRQRLLTRDPPVELSVVVDESVLHRKFGSKSIMYEQLLHLVEMSRLRNVEIRILPLQGEHPIGTGAFSYMRFPQVHDVPLNDRVAVEHLTGSHYPDEREQIFRYRVAFESLVELGLDRIRSRELISATARELWA